jgi:hypothetical protein
MTNTSFHNPTDFGTFTLATSQRDKLIEFAWDAEVLATAKIVFTYKEKNIRTYVVGHGLALSDANKTVTLELDGEDYEDYAGYTLKAHCNFFVAGDVEVTFSLRIIDSPL